MNFAKKIKVNLINRLKHWLYNYIPGPELIVEHRNFDIIEVEATIDFTNFPDLPNGQTEMGIIMEMIPELKKHVHFLDVEMHDGHKYKRGVLEIAVKARN